MGPCVPAGLEVWTYDGGKVDFSILPDCKVFLAECVVDKSKSLVLVEETLSCAVGW